LVERVVARHGFHGEWNYTMRPQLAEGWHWAGEITAAIGRLQAIPSG
jgi:hypothetical protein